MGLRLATEVQARAGGIVGRVIHRAISHSPIPPWLFEYNRQHYFYLPQVPMPEKIGENISTCAIGPAEAEVIAYCHENAKPDETLAMIRHRFENNCYCNALFDHNTCIGYLWGRPKYNLCEEKHRYCVQLPSNSIYLFDAYLRPEYRNYSNYPLLIRSLQDRMAQEGYTDAYCFVDYYNRRGYRALQKYKPRLLSTLLYIGFLGIQIHFVRSREAFHCHLGTRWSKEDVMLPVPPKEPSTPSPSPE